MIAKPEQIPSGPKQYRSIWISDVHLGTRHAQVDALLDFLRQVECEYLYLVGDIIDGWQLKSKWHWRDEYNVFIQKLLRKSRKDTQIIYITGNHDEFLEKFLNLNISFGTVVLAREVIHTAADGKRYLVLHGHQFDGLTQFNRVLEKVGTKLYDWILDFNLHFNRLRRRLGFGYWSLAGYLKYKAKSAVKYITEYEEAMLHMAHKHNVQGVICGHIHRAEIKMTGDVAYLNCGDWVESCTALVEDFEGNIQLIKLHENNAQHSRRGPGSHDSGDGGETDRGTVGTPDHERGGWPGRSTSDSGILCIGHEDAGAQDHDS